MACESGHHQQSQLDYLRLICIHPHTHTRTPPHTYPSIHLFVHSPKKSIHNILYMLKTNTISRTFQHVYCLKFRVRFKTWTFIKRIFILLQNCHYTTVICWQQSLFMTKLRVKANINLRICYTYKQNNLKLLMECFRWGLHHTTNACIHSSISCRKIPRIYANIE